MDARFATTRWTLVVSAGDRSTPQAEAALAELCQDYWYPLYAFVRRRGYSADDAQDLTQAYFSKLLEKNYLGDVKREGGRFRSFLLASLKHFLFNEWDKERSLKRGGRSTKLSLDADDAERRFEHEAADATTPEVLYERKWALTVLDRALHRLRVSFEESGRLRLYERLKGSIVGGPGESYQQVANDLGMSESAVKVTVHRMRKRLGRLIRDEIAHTVADPSDVDGELRHLLELIERGGAVAM
jgi:RNA polymerase sigma-70 factor (ECF subfamily)